MKQTQRQTIFRQDYKPSPYHVESIYLNFDLKPERTQVRALTRFIKNNDSSEKKADLKLDGELLSLISLSMDGRPMSAEEYTLTDSSLTIQSPPDAFLLEIETEINPSDNKALSGLYQSNETFCSQCEAEGFRRITYYLDRPDVLARFTTRIVADKSSSPVLLSNGNLIDSGDLDNGRHFAVWQDPFPKPCYLFALVAGDLACIEDEYQTMSGRKVELKVFVDHKDCEKCDHAIESLKKAMLWDEKKYGLEYDLDFYMIVAVDDFNMGAMENKGLNIFNSKYVLASPDSATDMDYLGIEGVVAHEYFHNWTGNRVTCRDWFQLSLKEGLTVFRDQEFSADMNSRPVKRINDIKLLRSIQFREDASPMAHPVRPDSYEEINNFYTVTVYNKGAEVVRMICHLIGERAFRKGMDLYFERFDGMAVTCDDFVKAMADASGKDLDQFINWYSQAGTPELHISETWVPERQQYIVTIKQSCASTPGQKNKKPFHIPVDIGLLEPEADHSGNITGCATSRYISLELTDRSHSYTYEGFHRKPVLSCLRGFTAPVKVRFQRTREELAFLMSYDTDLFNKWDASFTMATEIVKEVMSQIRHGDPVQIDPVYLSSFKQCLQDEDDLALTAQAITLPGDSYIAQQMEVIEPDLIHQALSTIKDRLATLLRDELLAIYMKNKDSGDYDLSSKAMGRRSLKNSCLALMMSANNVDAEIAELCLQQFNRAECMTDVLAALAALSHKMGSAREEAFVSFYRQWRNDSLVVDKWLAIQACANVDSALEDVKKLMAHEAFSSKKPNKVRSLIGAFCNMNHSRFHQENGAGYRFLADQIVKIDQYNPQIAARLVTPMVSYAKYTQKLRVQMEEQLRFLLLRKNLSPDVSEIVKKSLNQL